MEWDPKNPPSEYIELGGGEAKQFERPDMWIRPKDSVVVSVKAASVGPSDQFARGFTLRFPRFRRLRPERSWDTALSLEEFQELKQRVETEIKAIEMTVEDRRRRNPKRVKKELVIAGDDAAPPQYEGDKSKLFEGLEFCMLSESLKPYKKTKTQLESIIKENGGSISQRAAAGTTMILIGDKKVVKAASLIKDGDVDIVRPRWIKDCLEQPNGGFLLPYEEGHLFHATDALLDAAAQNTDQFGDSYARDVGVDELRELLRDMPKLERVESFDKVLFLEQLEQHGKDVTTLRSFMFSRCRVLFYLADGAKENTKDKWERYIQYAGGSCSQDLDDESVTHIVVLGDDAMEIGDVSDKLRSRLSSRRKIPRLVSEQWVEESWRERTLLDEERYVV
jgi:DNA ligase-4